MRAHLSSFILFVVLAVASGWQTCPEAAAATSPVPDLNKAIPAYDPKPFIPALNPYYAKKMKSRMHMDRLEDLPLYQLDLELDMLQGKMRGHLDLIYTHLEKKPLREILLRTLPNAENLLPKDREPNMRVQNIQVNGQASDARQDDSLMLSIPLPKALRKGQRVRVSLDFSLNVPKLPPLAAFAAFGLSPFEAMRRFKADHAPMGYGILGHTSGIFNLGFFHPILPARMNGDWDRGALGGMGDVAHFDVANYMIKLTVPNTTEVASSGIQVGTRPLGSGAAAKKEVYLLGAALRAFALQCSTRYQIVEAKAGRTRVRYFHVPESQGSADTVLKATVRAVKTYAKMFGPYPYSSLDVAEAPLVGGAGGMEYPGMITIAMAVTAGPSGNPMMDLMQQLMQQTKALEFVVAHEVGHQWWHALVGSDSNRHPFMDESLTNYSSVMYFEKNYSQDEAASQLYMQLVMPYQYHRMVDGKDGPVARASSEFGSQLEYTALIYGKGAIFYHALRKSIGYKTFLTRLKQYARKYAFRQAEPKDLLNVLAKSKGKKVRKLWKRWFEEAHADQDVAKIVPNTSMQQLQGLVKQIQGSMKGGFHNTQWQGQLDPKTMDLMQKAVNSLSGVPPGKPKPKPKPSP
ncbi:MAG: M1 family metallopeptidase [Deltaproteobacteria bacterium]|nr:M1 family metallopeptidase [Deltaproteobacteria bacterium]